MTVGQVADNWPFVGRMQGDLDMSQLENKINHLVRQSFMFHYAFLAASESVFGGPIVANCFKLLQTDLTTQIVADCSQTVAIGCKT